MSAVTVKNPYGSGDKGPPEPLCPLFCPVRMLWRGCLLFFKTEYNFLFIRCSTTALRGSSFLPTTELAFSTSLSKRLQIFVCSATPPADNSIEQCGSGPSCGRPLQCIVQQHPQVFAGLNSLYLPSINAD